jgi:hypothetical protein
VGPIPRTGHRGNVLFYLDKTIFLCNHYASSTTEMIDSSTIYDIVLFSDKGSYVNKKEVGCLNKNAQSLFAIFCLLVSGLAYI